MSGSPRDDRLTILHVTAPSKVGGLEQVVRALAVGHASRGHRVHVLAVLGPGEASSHPFLASLHGNGITLHALELGPGAYAAERRAIREIAGSLNGVVVHSHGYRSDVMAAASFAGGPAPLVTTVHGFVGGSWKSRVYEWLQRRAYRRFATVVAVSRPQMELLALEGLNPDRTRLLRNAWAPKAPLLGREEARAKLGIPEGEFRVGWVGRLSREKGADVLLEALARVGNPSVTASFVGTGSEGERLRAHAGMLGVAERVMWHGLIPDASSLLPAFDVFVLSSRTEGTPIALLEAMSAGIPIVATRVGGVPDVVSPAEAVLVASERPDELASAIEAIQRDPEAAETRTREAVRRLEREFDLASWLDEYEMIYRRALART